MNHVSNNFAVIAYLFQEFFVNCFRFSMGMIMASVNKDGFISSFPICILFISFSLLIALASNSSVERNTERAYPCLVPNLNGKTFSFSPFSITITYILFLYFFINWRVSPLFPVYRTWLLSSTWIVCLGQ